MLFLKKQLYFLKNSLLKFKGDKWLVIIPFVLSIFGLIMIYDASCVSAIRDFNDKFHYLKLQLVWLVLGVAVFLFFSKFDYRKLRKIALPLFIINIIFLILVLIPGLGKEVLGGKRWLMLGPFRFQPAELVKLSLVIYLSSLFEWKRDFLPFLLVIGSILGLVMLEPDLGTSVVIIGTALSLYFLSGAPFRDFIYLFLFSVMIGPLLIITSDYRTKRLLTFFNMSRDLQGDSYHLKQILLAIGSGGILGRGLGESRQKFLFLPEVTTDSIFAVIAEELGLIGGLILIFGFVFLIYRGFKAAVDAPDKQGMMLAAGITIFIVLQAIINLSSMVSLVPLTGVPLPFISYGGSSLIVCLAGMGIIFNISGKSLN